MAVADMVVIDMARRQPRDLTTPEDATVPSDMPHHPADLSTPPTDGAVTSDMNMSMPPTDGMLVSGDMSGASGDMSGPSGDMSLACTGSDDCGGATPLCCINATLGSGTFPKCPVSSASVACQATCDGKIALKCSATDTVRVCDKGADCAGDPGGYTNCCPNPLGMASLNVCVTKLIAAAIKCTPLP
jgi:hypothetical protein